MQTTNMNAPRACFKSLHPIVVDRGNGLNLETKRYASYAVQHGNRVELAEPESDWWHEIRVLLKYKEVRAEILDDWADRLAKRNRETHRTPVSAIRHWTRKWRHDITADAILNFQVAKHSPSEGGALRAEISC